MKYILTIGLFFTGFAAFAQTGKEQEVLKRIEALNKAVFTDKDHRNSAVLEDLLSPKVTYGHSSGRIENKEVMIRHAMVSPTTYEGFKMDSATVFFEGVTAVSRHVLKAKTFENGKEGVLHLGVLQVWIRTNNAWKLLARQAVKLP
ncbi:MAG: nuclear transport factor 2 family protein [Sediminibacterium sp.]